MEKIEYLYVNEIVKSVSETHSFDANTLYAVNTSDVENGKMLNPPLLPVEELKGQFKKTIQNGDILFSEIRPANRHFAVVSVDEPQQYVASTKLMVLRKFNSKVDSDYFYYWLTNTPFLNVLQRRAENRICSFPQITFELLSEYRVPIPSLKTQRQVAKFFSALDDKIANNNAICSDLESMAKLLYDYWFVQFDFPDENGRPYKSSGGKMVWNEELKREIPEGWECKPLGELCECLLGGTPSRDKSEYWNGDINWINSGAVNEFRISSCSERITKIGLKHTSTYLLPQNTTVLAITGATLGQVSILNIDACANQSVVGIKENKNMPTEYIYPTINLSMKALINNQTGAAQPHVNKQDIMNIMFVVPNAAVLGKYMKIVKPQYSQIMQLCSENEMLSSLRDFLLPMLMNGQVKVGKEN